MEPETKITVHRFSGTNPSRASRRPVRISIIRGKSNRTIYLPDDDVERLRSILAEAVHRAKDGWVGELKGE